MRVVGPPLRAANRAGISSIVAFSEVTSPFSVAAVDRTPCTVAGTPVGHALPTRNVSFRPRNARLAARKARLRAIPSAPAPRTARLPTFMSSLTVNKARLPTFLSRLTANKARPPTFRSRLLRTKRVYRPSQALSLDEQPVRSPPVVVARAPSASPMERSASTLEHSASSRIRTHGVLDGRPPENPEGPMRGLSDASRDCRVREGVADRDPRAAGRRAIRSCGRDAPGGGAAATHASTPGGRRSAAS